MIISDPFKVTHMDIWHPRYSDKWNNGKPVVLMHIDKVNHATSNIIVTFSKAKSLQGQRFAIIRELVQQCEKGSNKKDGYINMYIVPMNLFQDWQTPIERIKDLWPGAEVL